MSLITKLLDYIHAGFDKDSQREIALRVRHASDEYSYVVKNRVLTGYLSGVEIYSVDLSAHTIESLSSYLAVVQDLEVIYANPDELRNSACILIEGSGAQNTSNGDILWSYKSMLWWYLDSLSGELKAAKQAILDMLDQMSIPTADDYWLDEWGGYFGVPRTSGESDQDYGNRIIAEVLRPRGNNRAIELALLQRYGQYSEVVDIDHWTTVNPTHDGTYNFNGAINYDAFAFLGYGLFAITVGYDLLTGGDPPTYSNDVRAFVEKFRDAGTHLDSIALGGSIINDDDKAEEIDSGLTLNILHSYIFDGSRNYDKVITHGDVSTTEIL